MNDIIQLFSQSQDFQHILQAHQNGIKEQLITGLSGSSRSLLISALYREIPQSQLIVTHNLHQAQKLYEDLVEWVGEEHLYLYPVNELISSEMIIASPELSGSRIKVLNELIQAKRAIVIVPLAGVRRFLPPVELWREAQTKLAVGEELDLDRFKEKLLFLGYKRVEMVETHGEYSIRGGIIDIFPLAEQNPLRIELFDTEIESLRIFDVETQRSIKPLEEAIIGPTVEWIFLKEHYQQAADKLAGYLEEQLKKTRDETVREKLIEKITWEIEQIRSGSTFQGFNKYISCFYHRPGSILDYMPGKPLIILDEPTRIWETEEYYQKEELDWKTSLVQIGEYMYDLSPSLGFLEWKKRLSHSIFYLSLFLRQVAHSQPQNIVNFTARTMQHFHGQMPTLKTEASRWMKSNQHIFFLASSEARAKRMLRVLEDFQIEARLQVDPGELVRGIPLIRIARLQNGFELPFCSLVLVTEEEMFNQQHKKKVRAEKSISNAERIKNYDELQVGDYVVHVNHGIGKYLGIETLEIDGVHKDYLHIKYAGNDKLYVPVEQIDQVQKYIGNTEDVTPKLYSLGGSEWKRVKKKVKSAVQDIAADLIKIYAKREATPGYAFSKDSDIHQEFAAMFPYEETEDQLRAIREITEDMEKPRPMDRLLCGDVGYGKTEVAIRAAFKAVMDGKQVAVLVPTTILAQQHYETFRQRFQGYPVEIDVLSRFRTRKQQNETLKNLKAGLVDIIIGTHRLLSNDVQFKDLGLLIVDEEQRFGVTHKEKIKKVRGNIDVLTLTATPIPRTLHMSMLGVKDLSVIETPPENRFPVQTYVAEYNGALIREVIERELARNGQVFFLYNQVQGIERMAEEVRALVPDARVAIAHGQMKESELESVMLAFLEGEYDVLVSTTIIETGVDIPNVNTLIVYDADKLGLSQLYQLRGRVGRSNRMAYAYFTYRRDKVLTEVAEKRLQAIKEFTELGSGFKIAMRDLAIRGAGNILGPEQHGFIASVGFDLYSQMLKEAIEELKGNQPKEEEKELEFDVHLDAYIPESYIADGKVKIEMYKKVAAVEKLEEIEQVEEEFIDRFGPLPDPVWRLLMVARLKAYAKALEMESIVLKNDKLKMMFQTTINDKIDGSRLFQLVSQADRRFGLISGTQIGITFRVDKLTENQWLTMVCELLDKLAAADLMKEEKKSNALS